MDSKLVVEQMSGRWKIKHEDMRRLALEARERRRGPQRRRRVGAVHVDPAGRELRSRRARQRGDGRQDHLPAPRRRPVVGRP